jgi:hypothetical protein
MLVWLESLRITGAADAMPKRAATVTTAWIALLRLSLYVIVKSPACYRAAYGTAERMNCDLLAATGRCRS